jgi:hypothetical protein
VVLYLLAEVLDFVSNYFAMYKLNARLCTGLIWLLVFHCIMEVPISHPKMIFFMFRLNFLPAKKNKNPFSLVNILSFSPAFEFPKQNP